MKNLRPPYYTFKQIENGYVDIIDQRDRVMEVALNMVKKKPVVK
jgi:hypothetical protein